MRKKPLYYPIRKFPHYVEELKKRGEYFELIQTTYTRKIKKKYCTVFFNPEGEADFKTLCLINKVRKDAKIYMENDCVIRDSYINFFNMVRRPEANKIIHKIDIRGAYWNYAKHLGVVSKETNEYFLNLYEDERVKVAKKSRLKALGSLATKKYIVQYINGKPDRENELVTIEKTKPLYMEICRGIDDIMQSCVRNIEGCFYYYWDCIFIDRNFSQKAVDFFKDQKYDVKIGETKLEYIQLEDTGFLLSKFDGKMYMTRKENRELLIMN